MTVLLQIAQGMTNEQRFFLVLLTIFLLAIISSVLITDSYLAPSFFAVLLLVVLGISWRLWQPSVTPNRIRLYSLMVAMAVALTALVGRGWLQQIVDTVLIPLMNAKLGIALQAGAYSEWTFVPILVFVFAVILVVNWFTRDATAMGTHSAPLAAEFPERNYRDRLRLLCEELGDHLSRVNSETNWSHWHFVPLDAEVEILQGEAKRRRIMDLFAGLKANSHARLFLILGDPGAGKSVALRKLAQSLLAEVGRTGKLPVYVNLKEWSVRQRWEKENPPTLEQLREFVLNNLKSRLSLNSRAFLDTYFDRMFDHGRLFIILDSFDEIPAVLDSAEASWLIRELSEVVTRFLVGGNESRGVIASRYFRRPRLTKGDHCVLEIRPFSELKIATAINSASEHAKSLQKLIFLERPELAAVARNPFLLSLMIDYAATNAGSLPQAQAGLYEAFVSKSLTLAAELLDERGLAGTDVLRCTRKIAHAMFSSDRHGLEIPRLVLRQQLDDEPIDAVIDVLIAARVGRAGASSTTFSFVHRRFNEYFLIDRFREDPSAVPLEAIPSESRWRDAIVLYAEVANEAEGARMAAFAWGEMNPLLMWPKTTAPEQYLRALHSLRFMAEAFRGRRDLLTPYQDELGRLILDTVRASHDIVTVKHAVETVGLLPDKTAEETLIAALMRDIDWISETAFRACRYLPDISPKAISAVARYLHRLPISEFIFSYRSLSFWFHLSPRFSPLRKQVLCRIRTLVMQGVSTMFTTIAYPLIGAIAVFMFIYMKGIGAIVSILRRADSYRRNTLFDRMYEIVLPKDAAGLGRSSYFVGIFIGLAAILFVHSPFHVMNYLGNVEPGVPNEGVANAAPQSISEEASASLSAISPLPSMIALPTLVFGIILAIPWCRSSWAEAVHLVKVMVRSISVASVLTALLIVAGYAALVFLMARYFDLIRPLLFIAVIVSALVACVFFAWKGWQWRVEARRDHDEINKFLEKFSGRREQIAECFNNLRTDQKRVKLVQILEERSPLYIEILNEHGNQWPDGKRPNHHSDRASVLLAKMDVKWMGVER